MQTLTLWYCREHMSKTDTEEKKLVKLLFLYSLCTKSILVASYKVTIEPLMSHGLF